MLSSTLMLAELLTFAYLVLRKTRRPNVKSPDYLPNLVGTWTTMEIQTATGLGEKSSWDIFFLVFLVEKCLMFHRTNCCLGCVGCVYVGRIYQNRGEALFGCFGDFKYQHWLPEIVYTAFNANH